MTGIDAHAANQVSEQSPTAANGEAIMSNMNSRDRKAVYNYLARTHGEMCNLCKIDGNSKTLVVDHIDNNNSNNHPENVQLLCRRCNYKKNPRISEREPLDNCESVCPPIHYISFIHHENEIERSKKKEPLFRKYVIEKIESNLEWEVEDLINSGAEKTGISTITAERYLKKMCSSEGSYTIVSRANTDYVRKK